LSGNYAVKKRRKALLREAREAIASASDEDLKNMQHELGRQMGTAALVQNDLRLRLEAVKLEQEKRRTRTRHGLHISDHAVLRYLERMRGIDMAAVREEIVEMAIRAGRVTPGAYGRRIDPETGITLGVDERTENVTTVFKDAELPIMETV
jgi:hypothetical protein